MLINILRLDISGFYNFSLSCCFRKYLSMSSRFRLEAIRSTVMLQLADFELVETGYGTDKYF